MNGFLLINKEKGFSSNSVVQNIKKSDSKIENNILSKLSGMIRSKLSKIIEIRRVPKIIFKFDESIEYSENIEELLKNLK